MSRMTRIGAALAASAVALGALTGCVSSSESEVTEDNSVVQNETDTPNEIDVE